MSKQNRPLCTKNHPLQNIYFCKRCARDYPSINQSIDRIFFCKDCNPTVLSAHTHAGQRFQLIGENFKNPYSEFQKEIKTRNSTQFSRYIEIPSTIDKKDKDKYLSEKIKEIVKKSPPIYFNALKVGPFALQDLNSYQYRKWLADCHFWQRPYSTTVIPLIQDYVSNQFKVADNDPWANFTIQFNTNNAAAVDLTKQIEGTKERINELNREKLLSQFFVQITTCFTNEQIEKTLEQYGKIQGQLGSNLIFLLKLGKLKVLQLHDKGSQKMKSILKDININILKGIQKEFYYYYSAISQWKYVQNPIENEQSQIFLDARNKKHFKLQNGRRFIDNLTKAIDLSKKPVYYAIRGLGYMASSQYERAQADFEQAQKLSYKSDSLDNNRLLSKLRRKLKVQQFIHYQQLHKKKTQYIMNLCKHLQTDKKYRQLKVCCQELVNRQPRNAGFRVCLLKSLLKLKDTLTARQQLSALKDLNEISSDEIDDFQRKIELLKAYQQEELQNLSDAQAKFQNATKIGHPSSTDWYNFAAFLFKYRESRQRNEKALFAINNALQLKSKPEYLEIKYMLLFLMGNLDEAKKIQDHLTDPKFASMKQYVDNNV